MIRYLTEPGDKQFPDNPEQERARRVGIYASQYEDYRRELGIKVPDAQRTGPYWRAVFCPDIEPHRAKGRTGPAPAACFLSPLHAADFFGTSRYNVLAAIRKGTRCCRTYFQIIAEAPLRRAITGRERPVTCVEMDIDFETTKEAAEFAGVPEATMWDRLRDGKACGANGWTYRYVGADGLEISPEPAKEAEPELALADDQGLVSDFLSNL